MGHVGYSIVGVEVDKVTEFTVDDPAREVRDGSMQGQSVSDNTMLSWPCRRHGCPPFQQAVTILEFYPEIGVRAVEGIDRVCDSEFQVVEEDRDLVHEE